MHINVKIYIFINIIKYVHKYIYKNADRIILKFVND